tara:strand:- start:5344 stop:6861 length:1518 start_codon:yes stop_codon:yes gene_type:complete
MKTFFNHEYEPLSIVEQLIISIEYTIMQKPNWRQKIYQEEVNKFIRRLFSELVAEKIKWYQERIIRKWLAESIKSIDSKYDPENIFKYSLSELRWLAKQDFDRYLDGVWGSSELIDQDRLNRLQVLSKTLAERKPVDWHPHSNNQVRNLIHPSLYPLIRGISRDQNGQVIPKLKVKKDRWRKDTVSEIYQWLPAEVSVEKTGMVFTSKINNYGQPDEIDPVLGQILFQMLPLFELVLNDLENRKDRIQNVGVEYKEGDKFSSAIEVYKKEEGDEFDSDDNEMWDVIDVIQDDYYPLLEPIQPKVPDFVVQKENESVLGKNLQVIVKMANIELTPENPAYKGGSWHVEGMENEKIVATGIYYYDVENISTTKLAFRRAFEESDISYEQDDRDGVQKIFGITDDVLSVNALPSVEIKEGLAMVFPNTYQHLVEPFELEDKSKPGHRKILVFWLIDPSDRVFSTKDVLETPISFDQALEHRLKLMAERSNHQDENYGDRIREVSLCEH